MSQTKHKYRARKPTLLESDGFREDEDRKGHFSEAKSGSGESFVEGGKGR